MKRLWIVLPSKRHDFLGSDLLGAVHEGLAHFVVLEVLHHRILADWSGRDDPGLDRSTDAHRYQDPPPPPPLLLPPPPLEPPPLLRLDASLDDAAIDVWRELLKLASESTNAIGESPTPG